MCPSFYHHSIEMYFSPYKYLLITLLCPSPSCGEVPASICHIYKYAWDILQLHLWGYSILVWGSYIATFMSCTHVMHTVGYMHSCVHGWSMYAIYIGIQLCICMELHCAWKPLSVVPVVSYCSYVYGMPICVWDGYSSHTRIRDNIHILGRTCAHNGPYSLFVCASYFISCSVHA